VSSHHKLWWQDLRTGEDSCEVAPRDHGKSMSLARAYPLWKCKYDPFVKEVFLLGADQPSAIENLEKLREMALAEPTLSYLIPKTRSQGINSRTELWLTNGKKIVAKGYWSPLRGRHPQLIILDDVANDANSDTQDGRRKLLKRFYEVVLPMRDKGGELDRAAGHRSQIIVVGTIQDPEDMYNSIRHNTAFVFRQLKAVISEEPKEVLWPERYPYDELMKIKRTIGSLAFAKEYQNEPLTEESSIFPASLFESCKDRSLSYRRVYKGRNPVFLGADFSIPGTMDGDWTVYFTLEKDGPFLIPLWYWRNRPTSMKEQILKLEEMTLASQVTLGYLEDNMFQRIYSEHFRKGTTLPLKGNTVTHSGKSSVEIGILSFRPLFENGRIPLPYKTEEDRGMTDHLIREFNGVRQKKGRIGNETFHDDTVMALWHALQASREIQAFEYS